MLGHIPSLGDASRSVFLVVSIVVLLGSVGTTQASVYYSLTMESQATVSSPGVVLQNGTAGNRVIYANNTSAKVNAMAPGNWWNPNYNCKRQISIVNNKASTLSSGYSVNLTVNTASLVSSGKMLANGNDLRIAYWNGSSFVEIDREIINMNTVSTKVWFRTQANIGPSPATDNNYYMYYSYSLAGNPPTDWAKIYVVGDNFNDGSITSGLSTSVNGVASITEAGGEAFIDLGTADADAGMIVTSNSLPASKQFMISLKSKVVSLGSGQEVKPFSINQWNSRPAVGINTVYNPTRRIHVLQYATYLLLVYEGTSGRRYWNGTTWTSTASSFPSSLDTYYIWELTSNGTRWRINWRYANETIIQQTSYVPWSSVTDNSYSWWFLWSEPYTNYYWGDIKADFFSLRNYVEPEPSASLGSEQLYSSSSSNYNYVLKIVNQVSDTWKIRLKAYSQSNIGRLNNCTIYFRNSSDGTSRQIYIQNGAYVTQTGPWYDLPASPAERYIAITLNANNSQVSYVYVYLEILVPNKTTTARYVLTFEIT